MPYTGPLQATSWVSRAADSLRKTVLLAVRPLDTFTNVPADVPFRVFLKEFPQARPIQSLSGFLCFEGLLYKGENGVDQEILYRARADIDYTLIAEPDRVLADWFYQKPKANENWSFEFIRKVRLVGRPIPPPAPNEPPFGPSQWEPIEWVPNPSYPFPTNATLLRGIVKEEGAADAPPLQAVVVRATYRRFKKPAVAQPGSELVAVESLSNKRGEFVLFFKALPPNNPTKNPTTQDIKVGPMINGEFQEQSATIVEGTTKKIIIDAILP